LIARTTLLLLLVVPLAPSCKIPFGSAGQNAFVQASGDDRPCTLDEHCPEGSTCCSGRCAACCADVDCQDLSECQPGQCWDGQCRHDRPFSSPELSGAIEVPASVRGLVGMGSLVVLGLPSTILVADLRVPASPRFISSLPFPGTLRHVEASPPLLAALIAPPGGADPVIHVVDLSHPRYPRTLVALRLERLRAADLDATVLAAVSPGRIHLVDLSAPAEPSVLSRLDIDCPDPLDVEISGGEAAVACGEAGLVVVDLHDPLAPVVRAGLPGDAMQVSGAAGSWLVTGRQPGQASLVKVSTGAPASIGDIEAPEVLDFDGTHLLTPTFISTPPGQERVPLTGSVMAGELAGGRVYLARADGDGRPFVEIGRIGDGQLDREASLSLAPFLPLADVAFSGRRAALAGRGGGILVVDAADPGSPRVDHSFVLDARIVAMAWTGPEEIAVASDDGRLVLLDYSQRSGPPRTRTVDRSGGIVDMAPAGETLLVTTSDGTLESIEHRGVETPFVAASVPLAGAATIRAVAPDLVLVSPTGGDAGQGVLQSVALDPDGVLAGPASAAWKQPGLPVATDGRVLFDAIDGDVRARSLEGGVPAGTVSRAAGIDAGTMLWHEGRLWVRGADGLVVLDAGLEIEHATGTPPGPVPAGRLGALTGGIALVTDTGAILAETSLPPVKIVGRRAVQGASPEAGLLRSQDALRLAAGEAVHTLDGGKVPIEGGVAALDLAPGLLLASMGADGLAILAPGQEPVHVKVVALDAAGVPDGACVAAGENGLAIVDLADPARPEISQVFVEAGIVTEVTVLGLNCYAMQPGGSITVASLVDPGSPKLTGTLEAGQDLSPRHVWTAGDDLVVSEGRRLVFLQVDAPPVAQVHGSILLDGKVEGFTLDDGLAVAAGSLTWFIDLSGTDPVLAGSYDGPWDPRAVLLEGDRLLALGPDALWTLDLTCLR
jgi:hypothetical protein